MTTIHSWNVNGIRAVVRNGFLDWVAQEQPEILCLQEVRAHPDDLPMEVAALPEYTAYWQPAQKKGYSGTGLLTKRTPKKVKGLGIEDFDAEGRVQVIDFEDFVLLNAYFPNSQPKRARIDYKVAFCDAIGKYCTKLRKKGRHVILCGDYNIAHTEIDLARPKDNEDSPGYLPEERQAMTDFLAAGFVDTFRHFCEEGGHYTWWSYRTRGRERNVGWRLDYHCVDEELMPRVKGSRILSDVYGSDHCPVALDLD